MEISTTNMTGSLYCGLTLEWDYNERHVDVSMPGYVQRILQRFKHPQPRTPQHSPHKWDRPIYGQKIQYAQDDHDLPILPPDQITRIQQIVGCFLFYARAIDSTMLVALNTIGSENLLQP